MDVALTPLRLKTSKLYHDLVDYGDTCDLQLIVTQKLSYNLIFATVEMNSSLEHDFLEKKKDLAYTQLHNNINAIYDISFIIT